MIIRKVLGVLEMIDTDQNIVTLKQAIKDNKGGEIEQLHSYNVERSDNVKPRDWEKFLGDAVSALLYDERVVGIELVEKEDANKKNKDSNKPSTNQPST